jgi:4-amino-4-deoxy-L-arabinose transferase-like glycosyltransferase
VSYRLGTLVDRASRMPPAAVAGGLTVLGAIAFLPGLGDPPFYHLVEGDQALVVRAIYEGDWWLPKLNTDTLPSKPPLFNWLGALTSIVAGGVSETTVRLPSALLGAIGLVIVGALGRIQFGSAVGLLAALFLLTTPAYAKQAREATTDGVLSFCLLSAFVLFYAMYHRREWSGWRRRALFLAVAGAVLTKGPVGYVLPVLAIATFLALERDLESVRGLLSGPDKWLAILPPLAWYTGAIALGGYPFIEKQFINENFRRFTGGFGLPQPVTALVLPSITEALPWSAFFLISLARQSVRRSWTPATAYLACWWGAVLVVFSLAVGKRTIYLMPLYPAAALLAADQVWRWVRVAATEAADSPVRVGRGEWIAATASVVIAIVIVAATRLRGGEGPPVAASGEEGEQLLHYLIADHPLALALSVGAAIVATIAALARLRVGDFGELPLIVVLALAIFYVTIFPAYRMWHKDRRSVKDFGLEVASRVPSDEPLYFYRYGSIELPGYLYFYVGRPIPPSPCLRFPYGCPAGYYLMWERDWHPGGEAGARSATLLVRSEDTAVDPRYAPFVLVQLPDAG